MPIEIANALRYSGLPAERVSEIIDLVGAAAIHLFHPSTETLLRATHLAFTHGMSVYDALFLELAERLQCPLYTSDRRAFTNLDTPVDIRLL
jgi:predicted nucleic acid-binding protein